MEPVEICLSDPLSEPLKFPDVRLERWDERSIADGSGAWQVLPGVLLDIDGLAVRTGSYEPSVDCGFSRVRTRGEGYSSRRKGLKANRCPVSWLGGMCNLGGISLTVS